MVHSSCTDPTQATARLVVVLVSRRAVVGTTILSNGKGHVGPSDQTDRNDQTCQSGSPWLQSWSRIFRADQTEMVRSI